MGNKCSSSEFDLTDENLYAAEAEVLKFSGLPQNQIELKNVKVGEFDGKDVCMRTIICGDQDPTKPVLVLCHGYGGAGALFYRVMKKMAEKFTFITFDVIGMGGSSRPRDFDPSKISPQAMVDYFVEYLEEWRKAMNLD